MAGRWWPRRQSTRWPWWCGCPRTMSRPGPPSQPARLSTPSGRWAGPPPRPKRWRRWPGPRGCRPRSACKRAPLLGEALRKRRHGAVGPSWDVDETYVKVQGQWSYLYRAIDRDGNLVDARLSDTRDLAAAEAFFRSAWTVTRVTPDRMTTDGHDAYPRAIQNVFGERVCTGRTAL